jgi:hypothetical protein
MISYHISALRSDFPISIQYSTLNTPTAHTLTAYLAFTASAKTAEAHEATMTITKVLAHIGFRVLDDDAFFSEVRHARSHVQTTLRSSFGSSRAGQTIVREGGEVVHRLKPN